MSVAHPRALILSLLTGIALSALFGGLISIFGNRTFLYACGIAAFLLGLIAFALGVLGSLEPPEGWRRGMGSRRHSPGERRSVAAQIAGQTPEIEETSSWALAIWGVVVGGSLIGLAIAALSV